MKYPFNKILYALPVYFGYLTEGQKQMWRSLIIDSVVITFVATDKPGTHLITPSVANSRPTDVKLTALVELLEYYRSMTSFGHAHFRFGRWAGLKEII